MTYEQVKNLKPTEFKRLCGLYPETFKDMVKVLAAKKVLQKKIGRPSKSTLEDQILITLNYWRECRIFDKKSKNKNFRRSKKSLIEP